MKLVVDTNILVSFFRKNPVNEILTKSKENNFEFYSPEYAIDELKKNESEILKYGKISNKDFEEKLKELKKSIKIESQNFYKEFEIEAKEISPHEKDIPIFALAFKLKCGIWSNEPAFNGQSHIVVLSTRDVIEVI